MARRIVIVQGHPDASQRHLLHAAADAYAEGARAAGHEVRHIDVAALDFPLLRTETEFEKGLPPPTIANAQADLCWAQHWVFVFPLWHGTLPALLKGFLEQVFRPKFAMEYREKQLPKKLLKGRSAHIVVAMGMPAIMYRLLFGAFGVRSFEQSVLRFAGIRPVRRTFFGLAGSDSKRRELWLARMRDWGRKGL